MQHGHDPPDGDSARILEHSGHMGTLGGPASSSSGEAFAFVSALLDTHLLLHCPAPGRERCAGAARR